MSDKYKFNVFTNKIDLVEHVPQLDSDPASPRIQDAWVRKTGSGSSDPIPDGTPIGMLLGLTYYGDVGVTTDLEYDLNYRTDEETTIRIPFDRGGTIWDVTTVTGSTTLTTEDNVIVCNTTGAMTITLPGATSTGRIFNVKNINIGVVTVDGNGSETIDGDETQEIDQYECITVVDYASGAWVII